MSKVEGASPLQQASWELADAVALELVGRETDVNEVQKVVTHVRVQAERDAGRVGQDFFALLEAMVNDGRYLVRSGRTLDYYRDLRDVCGRHLRGFRSTTPESGWELVGILGWAARLMRYYRSPEGKAELAAKLRGVASGEARQEDAHARAQQAPQAAQEEQRQRRLAPAPPPAPPKPRPRQETKREVVTLVSVIKAGKATVRTKQDEEVTCTGMPSYPRVSPGEVCRADVTREEGRALKAMFKGWVS
ncbi:MAG TPA: hypothetical protein VJ866_05810 [Pyrinomonadaceae bacterium]|nr:hypothetical protein [Pyrinomonadaceae bacterium]